MVRIHVRRIAVDDGAVAQPREEAIKGRQVSFMNQEVSIAQPSGAEDAIDAGDQVGALEQDAVDSLLPHLAQHGAQLFEFDLILGTDPGIFREVSLEVSLNVGDDHPSRSG